MSGEHVQAETELQLPISESELEGERTVIVEMPPEEQAELFGSALADSEIDGAVEESAQIETQVTDVMGAVSALEAIEDLIHSSLETGGMSDQTAQAVNIALEGIYSRLGVYDSSMKVGMESLTEDRLEGTRLSLEGVSERIKTIWNAIVEMIRKIIRWATDVVGDYFTMESSLEKRRDALLKSLTHIKGLGRGDITDGALLKRLYSPDVEPRDVANGYKDLAGSIVASSVYLSGPASVQINRILQDVKEISISSTKKEGDSPSLSKTVMDIVNEVVNQLFDKNSGNLPYVPKSPAGSTAFSTDLKLGNTGWYAHRPDSWDTIDQLRFGTYHGDSGEFDFLPVLTVTEMKIILTSAASMKRVRDLHKANITAMSQIEKVIGLLASALPNKYNRPGIVSENTKAVRAVLKILSGKGLSNYGVMVRVTRDVLRLSELSVKEHIKAEGMSTTPSKSREMVPA